jgi:hypothetical protein
MTQMLDRNLLDVEYKKRAILKFTLQLGGFSLTSDHKLRLLNSA